MLADRLGYQYLLQTDDDAGFTAPVNFDIVQHMRRHNLSMSTAQVVGEPIEVTTALPELTAYFLTSEGLQPATLFQHCRPPSLQGLFTPTTEEEADTGAHQLALPAYYCADSCRHPWAHI